MTAADTNQKSGLADAGNADNAHEFSEVIRTRTASIRLRSDGIVYNELFPNAEVTLDDAIANVKVGATLCGTKKLPVLVKFGSVKSLSRDARQYFGGAETAKCTSAIALLISSSIGKVIGNFMIGFNKTLYPTRLFTSEDEAIAWLKGFLK